MSKSIIQKEKKCYISGRTDGLHEHHLIGGTGGRPLSEKYGLKIYLHHSIHSFVHHDSKGSKLNLALHCLAQEHFEKQHTREEFIQTFRKSFIDTYEYKYHDDYHKEIGGKK